MDKLDFTILETLMENGRNTWTELAKTLGITSPSVAERVRKLEEQGLIKKYTVIMDPYQLRLELMSYVAVTLGRPEHRKSFLEKIHQLSEVLECHHIAGEDDYLLKIRCRNTRDLDRVISEEIKGIPGVMRTKTTIVMDTVKETSNLPLPSDLFET
jgi:Lrp/AsnC family transcriptional regulator, leucine-responsive regulatory protein